MFPLFRINPKLKNSFFLSGNFKIKYMLFIGFMILVAFALAGTFVVGPNMLSQNMEAQINDRLSDVLNAADNALSDSRDNLSSYTKAIRATLSYNWSNREMIIWDSGRPVEQKLMDLKYFMTRMIGQTANGLYIGAEFVPPRGILKDGETLRATSSVMGYENTIWLEARIVKDVQDKIAKRLVADNAQIWVNKGLLAFVSTAPAYNSPGGTYGGAIVMTSPLDSTFVGNLQTKINSEIHLKIYKLDAKKTNAVTIATTITDKNGQLVLGDKLSPRLVKDIRARNTNDDFYVGNSEIYGKPFRCGYKMLMGEGGEVGILEVAIPTEKILQATNKQKGQIYLNALLGLLLSMIVIWWISSKLNKPLADLTLGTEMVAQGNFAHRIKVVSSNEIGFLAEKFNWMTENIQKQQEELLRQQVELVRQQEELVQKRKAEKQAREKLALLNKTLEQKVNRRTASIKNILNNAGQGFLTFGDDLCVHKEYSTECIRVFGDDIVGKKFPSLILPDDQEQERFLEAILLKILQENDGARRDIYLPLLPGELSIGGKYINIDYKLISLDEQEDKKVFMVILTDITEKRALESRMEEEKNILKMVVKVVVNYNDFSECLKDYRKLYQVKIPEILSSKFPVREIVFEIFRSVHTFKGAFSQYDMVNLVKELHGFETAILELKKDLRDLKINDFQEFLSSFRLGDWLEKDLEILKGILGEQFFDQENVITVDRAKIIEIEKKMLQVLSPAECNLLLPEVRRLRYRPFKDLLYSYPEYVEKLAEKLTKYLRPLTIEGGDFLVDTEKYYAFTRSLVHVFRNILDHGLETIDERIESGKDEYGSIRCWAEKVDNKIILTIADDGRGIDILKIRQKAVEKGLYNEAEVRMFSDTEVVNLIFRDGFSTTEKITELSGRGVGLSAVAVEAEKLGGRAEVKTQKGMGTEFSFVFSDAGTSKIEKISTDEIIEPLFESTKRFMTEHLEIKLQDTSTCECSGKLSLRPVTAFIHLKGLLEGKVVLTLDEELMHTVVGKFILGEIDEAEEKEYFEDTLAEVANTIVGNSVKKIPLLEEGIIVETPITICSEEASIKYLNTKICTYTLTFAEGKLCLSFMTSDKLS